MVAFTIDNYPADPPFPHLAKLCHQLHVIVAGFLSFFWLWRIFVALALALASFSS